MAGARGPGARSCVVDRGRVARRDERPFHVARLLRLAGFPGAPDDDVAHRSLRPLPLRCRRRRPRACAWAPTSPGGGLKGIPGKAVTIGCEGIQIFASSPQMWRPPSCKPAEADAFRAACAEASLGPIAVHAIYLVNPASRERRAPRQDDHSRWSRRSRPPRCSGASVVVTHLGSSKGSTKAEALDRGRAAPSPRSWSSTSGPVRLLFETSAGAGETMGGTFEELGEMIRTLGAPANLGTCIDTAHIFTAGYDLRTADDLERTLETFDREVGLDKLGAVHLNDSKAPFGSNKDRHENLGDGEIGAEALGRFIRHPALGETPLYLEVPGYDKEGPDRPNMERIFELAGRPFPLPPAESGSAQASRSPRWPALLEAHHAQARKHHVRLREPGPRGRVLGRGARLQRREAQRGLRRRQPTRMAPARYYLFIKVPEPRTVKNRVHVDFGADNREAEIERLIGLGATRGETHTMAEFGITWTVLQDPEGNELCVGQEGEH